MEIVYNGYDNEIKLRFSEIVAGIKRFVDFSGATSVELVLPDIPQTVTSDIDWSHGKGVVTFKLGDDGLPLGDHRARVVINDVLHPNGQILIHEDSGALKIKVV